MFLGQVVSGDPFSKGDYGFIDSGREVFIRFRGGIYKVGKERFVFDSPR